MAPPCSQPSITNRCLLTFVIAVLGFNGCGNSEGLVTLRVTTPPGIYGESAQLVLTRFDISEIVDSVAATADVEQPDFSGLLAEMTVYEQEPSAMMDSLRVDWLRLRAGIVHLADSLGNVARDAPGYATAYEHLRALHLEVTSAESRLERRMGDLVPATSVDLARRAIEAADSIRLWEMQWLAGVPGVLDSLSSRLGPALLIPLPSDGHVERHLATGDWWVAMRVPHPENPFLEYYWESSFRLNSLVPVIVPLDERHMSLRWRH